MHSLWIKIVIKIAYWWSKLSSEIDFPNLSVHYVYDRLALCGIKIRTTQGVLEEAPPPPSGSSLTKIIRGEVVCFTVDKVDRTKIVSRKHAVNQRQKQQQEFEQSEHNLIVGSELQCPLSPKRLARTTADCDYVVETFESGLTAQVFHIRIDGRDYTLKKKRPQAKVKNLDGQYSFLNEVQRRSDFQALKSNPDLAPSFQHIVETIYANYRLGIILSEWIEGSPVRELTEDLLAQLFSTLHACERAGLFEWDLCSGNLLVDRQGQLKLFDFGYMYPFIPTSELNSNGMTAPLFHFCERFETRFLSGWLLEQAVSEQECLSLFTKVKRQAALALESQITWLKDRKSCDEVIDAKTRLLQQYKAAFKNEGNLSNLFTLEMFRSHVLDIEDDLEGRSCTPTTIKRVEKVLAMLKSDFPLLQEQGALFYHNQDKSQVQLREAYLRKMALVVEYQL